MRLSLAALTGLAALAASGCDSDETATGGGGGAGTGAGGLGGAGGSDACAAEAVPAPASTEACDRMPGGSPGANAIAVDLSAAHVLLRFFGPIDNVDAADHALVAGFAAGDVLTSGDVSAYGAALPGALCARTAAASSALGPASVEMRGTIAWIKPGTGAVTLPPGAGAVVVDLRDLPDVPELRAAIEAAVAPALAANVPRPDRRVRRHDGMVDEYFSANNVYQQSVATIEEPPIAAAGTVDLALGVVTGPVLAPEAAEVAIALRAANRAFIIGEDVRADVAESRWQGVGSSGVYVRTEELRLGTTTVPDLIAADRRSTMPECVAAEVVAPGLPPAWSPGEATRAGIDELDPFEVVQPEGTSLAEAEAALVVSHGAVRKFFPYFPVVGDTIDDRLIETLESLEEPLDAVTIRNTLRRFGEAIHDGHMFVFNAYAPPAAGFIPAMIEDIANEPVVRRSLAVGINAGDTITSIDGVSMQDFYATELARSGGATPGYQRDIATRELVRLNGPVDLGLRDPSGATRTITFTPQPVEDYLANGFAPSLRPAGFLDDLGAPTIYYINLDSTVTTTTTAFNTALTQAQGATGLVIDMRGYPGIDHYAVASRLAVTDFSSPVFRVTTFTGPDESEVDVSSYPLAPSNPFTGPIVLLVSHHTVSAAENFSTMLVDVDRVTVVGRNSAGTNGNITGVNLPGGFVFTFTGMDVRHADGNESVFHGSGIKPAAETVLTAADFASGADPELLEAIDVLTP